MSNDELFILYYIHILSLSTNFYSRYINNNITQQDYIMIYHALIFYCYIILLYYGLYHIRIIRHHYLIILVLYYFYLQSIT